MSNEKGKGKGKAEAPTSENLRDPVEDDAPSMLSRIAASASGLSRNAFSGSNSIDTSITTLATSGKVQSTSTAENGHSAWAESSQRPRAIYATADGPTSITLGHNAEHIKKSEKEFSSFLNGIDSFSSNEPSGTIGADSYKDIGRTWGEEWAWAQTVDTPEFTAPDFTSKTVAEQEAQDGQEVLDLLSSPGWITQDFEAPPEDKAQEDYDWGLSQDQISEIRAMTRHLAAPEPRVITDVDHPLNLLPTLDAMGRAQWIGQWEDVLTRYADEVWGGLLPLVREARKEVEDIPVDITVAEKPSAVRRLEAILGHLQQH